MYIEVLGMEGGKFIIVIHESSMSLWNDRDKGRAGNLSLMNFCFHRLQSKSKDI